MRGAGQHKADVLSVVFFVMGKGRLVSLQCSAWWSVWVRLASPPRVRRGGGRAALPHPPSRPLCSPREGGCVATLLPTPGPVTMMVGTSLGQVATISRAAEGGVRTEQHAVWYLASVDGGGAWGACAEW